MRGLLRSTRQFLFMLLLVILQWIVPLIIFGVVYAMFEHTYAALAAMVGFWGLMLLVRITVDSAGQGIAPVRHALLGEKRSQWFMLLLWVAPVYTFAAIHLNLAVDDLRLPIYVLYGPFSIVLALVLLRRAALKSWRRFLLMLAPTVALSAILYFGMDEALAVLADWPRFFGVAQPELPLVISNNAIFITLMMSILGLVVAERIGYSKPLRWVIIGFIGGNLITIMLAYPVFTFVYDEFVPQVFFQGQARNQAFNAGMIATALISIGIGVASAWFAGTNDVRQRAIAGSLSGTIAGTFVFMQIVTWATGIAAHANLYGVAVTRSGFENAAWVIQLGIAINRAFPYMMLGFASSVGIVTVLSTISAVITPIRFRSKQAPPQPEDAPLWVMAVTVVTPIVFLFVLVFVIITALLFPTVRDLLLRYNYDPVWEPDLSLQIVAWLCVLAMFGMFVAITFWLRHRLRTQQPIKLPIAMAIFAAAAVVSSWYIFLPGGTFGLLPAVLAIEVVRLGSSVGVDPAPMIGKRQTVVAGLYVWIIFLIFVGGAVSAILSMLLIAVIHIETLAEVSMDPPGVEWLLETLESYMSFMTTMPTLFSIYTAIFFVLLTVAVALNMPIRIVLSFAPRRTHIQPQHDDNSAEQVRMVVAIIGFGLLVYAMLQGSTPMLALWMLWGILVIRINWLKRLPVAVIAITLLAGLAVLPLIITGTIDLPAYLIVAMGLVCAVIYQAVGLYAPPENRSIRYLIISPIFVVMLMFMSFLLRPRPVYVGGVGHYDGTRWIVYDRQNSTLGLNFSFDVMQHSDGSIWFINPGGAVSTFSDDTWNILTVSPTYSDSDFSRVERRARMIAHRSFIAQDAQGNVWYANHGRVGLLRDSETDESDLALYEFTLCDSQTGYISASFCEAYSHTTNLEINGLATSGNTVWYGGDAAAIALQANPTNTVEIIEPNGIAEESTTTLLTADSGAVYNNLVVHDIHTHGGITWMATTSGLVSHDDATGALRLPGGTEGEVYSVHVDASGTVWYGTTSYLMRLSANRVPEPIWQSDPAGEPLEITALTSDGQNNLWMGTNQGLFRVNPQAEEIQQFTNSDSGLVSNVVRDVLVADNGDVWVTTFETAQTSSPIWVFYVITYVMMGGIASSIVRDYRMSPKAQARQIAREITEDPELAQEKLYQLVAELPDRETLQAVATELRRFGYPRESDILTAYAQILADDVNDGVQALIDALEPDTQYQALWAILQQAHHAETLTDVVQLELVVIPGHDADSIGMNTRTHQITSLPEFIPSHAFDVLRSLARVALNLDRYAEVNATGDRLSYLAAALATADSTASLAQGIPPPMGVVFNAIARRWRALIVEIINELSGSADLRIELRTRQLQHRDTVTLVFLVTNTGRSAAEDIRVQLHGEANFDIQGDTVQHLKRLPPNHSESIEFVIAPADAESSPVQCRTQWNDRLDNDKSTDYSDEIRFYRTVAEFQPIPNPYIIGNPVKASHMFFGREDVFQFIERNLRGTEQNRTIVLYGERRTGKTSLLYQLVQGRLGQHFIATLIDMQALILMVETTADFLDEILYQMESVLEDANIAVNIPDLQQVSDSPVRTFDRFLDDLSAALGEQNLLIIFDEFELIEQKIDEGKLDASLLDYFRSVIQHRSNIAFIFTGTHRLEEMSHDYWSTLFNIALTLKITYLDEPEAIRLIREPVQEALTVDDLAVEKILRLTGRHPYFIQLICWALVNHCHQHRRNYATINDVTDALATILTTGEAYFSYIWQQASPQEQLILAAHAHAAEDNGWARPAAIGNHLRSHGEKHIQPADLTRIADHLVLQEIFEQTVDGALRYRYRLDVLRLWIRQSKSVHGLLERQTLNAEGDLSS